MQAIINKNQTIENEIAKSKKNDNFANNENNNINFSNFYSNYFNFFKMNFNNIKS